MGNRILHGSADGSDVRLARPISLSDAQLDAVMTAAEPLQPSERGKFLEALADALRQQGELGDGALARTVRHVIRRSFVRPSSAKSWWRAATSARRSNRVLILLNASRRSGVGDEARFLILRFRGQVLIMRLRRVETSA
jgi:hypothetical protein